MPGWWRCSESWQTAAAPQKRQSNGLHRHSELDASDGTPSAVININADGNVWIYGTGSPIFTVERDSGAENTGAKAVYYMRATTSGVPVVNDFGPAMLFYINGSGGAFNIARIKILQGSQNGSYGHIAFQTAFNGSVSTRTNLIVRDNGYVAVGLNATPDARFEVETGASDGQQAITIDQNDTNQAFIDFQGLSTASANNSLSSWTAGNTIQGFIRQEVNGATVWMPYYDAPTS